MGMVDREGPHSRPCPCYLRCEDCLDFRKIANNRDGGLAIYHRAIQKEKKNKRGDHVLDTITSTEDIFILQNSTSMELASTDFVPVLEMSQISCPRCKIICEHARQLLLRLPMTNRKINVMAICDHCRINAQLQKQCTVCDDTVKSFLMNKDHQKDKKSNTKAWLSKIHIFLKGPIPKADRVQSQTPSEIISTHDERSIRSKPQQTRISHISTHHSNPDISDSLPYPEKLKKQSTNLDKIVSKVESTKSLQDSLAISHDSDVRRMIKTIKERVSSIPVPDKFQVTLENYDYIPSVKDGKPSKKTRLNLESKDYELLEMDRDVDATIPILKKSRDISLTPIKKYPSFETLFSSKMKKDSTDSQMSYFFPIREQITDKLQRAVSSAELIYDTRVMLQDRQNQLQKDMEEKKRIYEENKRIYEENKRIYEENKLIYEENKKRRKDKLNQIEEKNVSLEQEKRLSEEENIKIDQTRQTAEENNQKYVEDDTKKFKTSKEKLKSSDTKYISKNQLQEMKKSGKDLKIESDVRIENKKTLKEPKQLESPKSINKEISTTLEKSTQVKAMEQKESKKRSATDVKSKNAPVPEIKPTSEQISKGTVAISTESKDTRGKENLPDIKDSPTNEKSSQGKGDTTHTPDKKEQDVSKPVTDKNMSASNGPDVTKLHLPKKTAEEVPIPAKTLKIIVRNEGKTKKSELNSQGSADKIKSKQQQQVGKNLENEQKKKHAKDSKLDTAQQAKDSEKEMKRKKSQQEEDKIAKKQAIKKRTEISDTTLKQKAESIQNVDESHKGHLKIADQVKKPKGKPDLAILELQKSVASQNREAIQQLKLKKKNEMEEKRAHELANKKLKQLATEVKTIPIVAPKIVRPIVTETIITKLIKPEKIVKELDINKIKLRKPSTDDLILNLVKLKQSTPKEKIKMAKIWYPVILKEHGDHKGCKNVNCPFCQDSDLEMHLESLTKIELKEKVEISEFVAGEEIIKHMPRLSEKENHEPTPMLFQSAFHCESALLSKVSQQEEVKIPEVVVPDIHRTLNLDLTQIIDPEQTKGIIRYALSDRTFIEKGWTMLPTEKVVRKMNVYRMRPAHPEFDWFEHNKNKKVMHYDSGEILAEFDDSGRGRWYYRNGRLALDYYDAEEINAQQRIVVYSSGEPDERGRTHPITVLAMFDYLGNGVVFDHSGKIRLKYNQTEGVVLDRGIGPVSHWKWHTLNDPPVLQQVMIDTQMAHKDPEIVKLGPADAKSRPDNEDMLAIEFDNFIKEKSKKLTQTFKPFQIKMKALKINENFSLRVLDQATVYLIYRDGTTNLKLNIGMILDHKEIVDTDTAELGDVSNSLERFPARTDSLAGLQCSVAHVQRFERGRSERERRLRPPEPSASADRLTAAASRPLRPPFRTLPTGSTTTVSASYRRSRRPPTCNLYYDTRLP